MYNVPVFSYFRCFIYAYDVIEKSKIYLFARIISIKKSVITLTLSLLLLVKGPEQPQGLY